MFEKGINTRVKPPSFFKGKHNLIFFNPIPLATACFFPKELVDSAIKAIFKAAGDLAFMGKHVEMDFGFVKIQLANKNVEKVFFKK